MKGRLTDGWIADLWISGIAVFGQIGGTGEGCH